MKEAALWLMLLADLELSTEQQVRAASQLRHDKARLLRREPTVQ